MSPPLSSELFSAQLYKPTQGRLTRQITCGAIWLAVALGAWRLWITLTDRVSQPLHWGLPIAMLLVGLWVGFRVVNWSRFADFLISVEAELKKVSWPTRGELIRASAVVIFTIGCLAVLMFGFDLFWDLVGKALRYLLG